MPVFGQCNTANYAVRDRVNHDLAGDASPHQRGGKLVTSSDLNFLGTIHEASTGTTDVLNTTNAVEEVFHRSTGVLDLLNKADIDVAELKFAGAWNLDTTPDGQGYEHTTAHHMGSLPTIFTH